MKKTLLRIICFLLLLSLLLYYWNSVFKFKYGDGIYDLNKFYELDNNSVDVLILGSSHAFEDFNTGTLWDEYGMATYILAGSEQPVWNTYYYLKEALKTQTPKLIVFEGFMLVKTVEYSDESRIIKNNFGLRFSLDKIESMKISSPKEHFKDYFFEYYQYHSRYKELSVADFYHNQGNVLYDDWKGFGCNMVTTPYEIKDVSGVSERTSLFNKTELYYRAILELAASKDIPVFVVISPYGGINENDQRIFNAAEDIANDYGVSFLNCNLLFNEIGIDGSSDISDYSHLNYKGNQKFSSYIGKVIKENFDVPDRRGDSKYISWERHADYIRQIIKDQELLESKDVDLIFDRINDERYWTFISIDGNCDISDSLIQNYLMQLNGFDTDSRLYYWANGELVWKSSEYEDSYYTNNHFHDFYLKRVLFESDNNESEYVNSIIIDNSTYNKVKNGINIVVYDFYTEKLVLSIGFDSESNYTLVR